MRLWAVWVSGAQWSVILTIAAVKWWPGSLAYVWAAVIVASVPAAAMMTVDAYRAYRRPKAVP